MKILISSTNNAKIKGAKDAFSLYFNSFDISGIKVPSDVSEQPINEQIYQGAKNRINHLIEYAKENKIDAEYFLSIESGITNFLGQWINISIAIIIDQDGNESMGTSPGYPVPEQYIEQIRNTDLAQVMNRIFSTKNSSINQGGIALLTHGNLSRSDLSKQAFIMALTSFINEQWKTQKKEGLI